MTEMLLKVILLHTLNDAKKKKLFNTERCWYALIAEFSNSTIETFNCAFSLIIIIKMNCAED